MNDHSLMTLENAKLERPEDLDSIRSKALIVGGVGALATIVGFFLVPSSVFYRAYLVGWVYCIGIALGLFMLTLMTHLSGGRWARQMKRVHEAAGRSVWLFAVLALPWLIGGMHELYPWVRPEAAGDALIQAKADYLKLWFDPGFEVPTWRYLIPGFYPRQILYFALWGLFAWRLSSLSNRHDETGDPKIFEAMQKWSAAGLLTFVMVATFASIDWLMSTEPHWFSSLYGPQLLNWQGLSALAVSIPLMAFLYKRRPLDRLIRLPRDFHDYGKLLLAFTMVWGYFTLSQFLIIWSGDLPEEVPWYLYRNGDGWKIYTILLVIFTFFVPFLILLWRKVKFDPRKLSMIAVLILVTRWFDYYWQVAPNLHHDGVPLSILFEWVPTVAMGGLWLWLVLGDLRDRPLVPIHDPLIREALAEGEPLAHRKLH